MECWYRCGKCGAYLKLKEQPSSKEEDKILAEHGWMYVKDKKLYYCNKCLKN